MTKTLAIALVAAMGFAGAASAATDAQVRAAQDKLETYGFDVDASTLSEAQISMLNFVHESQANDAESDRTSAKGVIRAILN